MDSLTLLLTEPQPPTHERRLVLCGSMAFAAEMADISRFLTSHGIPNAMPEVLDPSAEMAGPEDKDYKRKVSRIHMDKIKDPSTTAVLVANFDKRGVAGYIGPNTFAEIAVAFSEERQIYLLYGLPDLYREELSAWGAVDLEGELKVEDIWKEAPPTNAEGQHQ